MTTNLPSHPAVAAAGGKRTLTLRTIRAAGFILVILLLGLSNPASVTTQGPRSDGPVTGFFPIVQRIAPGLKEAVSVTRLTLPQPLARATDSWCTWGACSLGPRLYHQPLADGRTLLGWTDLSGNGHVSVISGAVIERTYDYPGEALRGLTAHDAGAFAVLLFRASDTKMYLSKRNADGGELWRTDLSSAIAAPDFWLGDSRLTYGNGRYLAYYTVKGTSGNFTGHYGDQLTYVDDAGARQYDGWDWGCSHSMAQLASYHPGLGQFISSCSSDCYPGKGIFLGANGGQRVYEADGNCGGNVSAQLGQIALGDDSWKLVFNALDRTCCEGHGVALATISAGYQSNMVWLTHTNGATERNPVIARLGDSGQGERYLTGWNTTNDDRFWLAIIDGSGNFMVAPEEVSSKGIGWGDRDDSFRTRPDGTVSWVWGESRSAQVSLYRFDGSAALR